MVEDEGQASDWSLVLAAHFEKVGWTIGMALRFEGTFYRLAEIQSPAGKGQLFEYRFNAWPPGAILRKVVDYEADCVEQLAKRQVPLSQQLKGWLRRPRS